MRDFRDAKAMAHTLRASLASKGLKITVSQSLELIAELFSLPDWNTLAAAIRRGLPNTDTDASGQPRASVMQSQQDSVSETGKPAGQEIAVNVATLDGYVGFYQLGDDAVLAVTRDEDHLVTRLTGQRQVPIYAQSKTEFFAKLVNARFIFIMGAKGQAASLVLRQHGQDHPMKRIDGTTAQEIESKLAGRVKSQSADPRSEAALRRLIDGLASGKPNYHEMIPALAELTRQQLPNLQMGHLDLGAVQSIKFLGVGRQGEDVYTVNHENGASHWRIKLDSKGAISMAAITPGP
jgi:hypothetical protein